jgi:hypothetical protein
MATTKKTTKRNPAAAKPVRLTRRTALIVGSTYGGAASALSFYAAHYALPLAIGWRWYAVLAAVIGGLLLSAPTCYRTIVRIKGEDRLGQVTAAGMVVLFETLMCVLTGPAAYVAGALVLGINAWSGAQQAEAKLTR